MEKLLKLLQSAMPNKDFSGTALIDDSVLDSLDVVTIVSEISREFDIEVPAEEITPENFNSVAGMWAMVERLEDE